MAIKKIKWTVLINQIDAQDILDDTEQELVYIDDKLNELTLSMSAKELRDLMKYVDDGFLHDENNVWEDLNIYVSSFKENDKRFILLLKNKLREYLGFYKKILDNSGVQRALLYSKTYENDGNANSVERGTNSQTPQNSSLYNPQSPESDALFDQAIADYASAIDKQKAHSDSHSEGGSDTTVSGTTWEEGKKNLQLLFFNELKDYLMSIPERIYAYYSLDTVPFMELHKMRLEYFQQIKEMISDE